MTSIINADDGSISGRPGLRTISGTSANLQIQVNGTTVMNVSSNHSVTFNSTVHMPSIVSPTLETMSLSSNSVSDHANQAFNAANTAVTSGQANVGAGLITTTAAYQANTGAARIEILGRAGSAFGQANLAYGAANTKLASAGGTITGNLQVDGNLIITGTTTTVSANNLVVKDNMFYLNDQDYSSNVDLGFAGNYNDGTYRHTGLFRDASDGIWKFYDNYLPEPDAAVNIDTSNTSFRIATVFANVKTDVISVRGMDPLGVANSAFNAANTAVTSGQANVGAGLITTTAAYQANVGSGLITAKSTWEANTGAGLLTRLPLAGGVMTGQAVLNYNIATPSNYYNALQLEIRATSGTAGIGLHRNGYSHCGIYHDTLNTLKFDMNGGSSTLNATTGTILGSGNYSSYALPLSGGTVTGSTTFSAQVTTVGNGGSDTGLGINYGSGSGDYARIRFIQAGTNNQTFHIFSTNWQGGGFTNNSAGAINIAGANGTTFGAWNSAGMAINNSGEMWLRSNLYLGYNSATAIGSNFWAGGGGYSGYQFNGGNSRFGFSSTSGVLDVYADGNFYATDSSYLVLHAANYSSYALPLSGGTLTSSTKIKAGHGDTRLQLHYNHDNADTTSGYAGYLTLWASEPGLSYAYCGIGGNINLGGQWYGRATSGQTYGLYLRFETTSGYSEFWATTGAVGATGGQGSRVAYIDASGNAVFAANVTAYSDERLKANWRNMPANYVARLAKVKVGIYDRTDQVDVIQVGVSAQSLQELLPQAIMTTKDEIGTLSVSYGNAALASAVELAKDNVELRERITRLETIIEQIIKKE